MRFIELPLDSTILYERGIPGDELLKIYGVELAPMVYDYIETSNPIVFDKNKELIQKRYKDWLGQGKQNQKTHLDLFFYRLKKIIFLTDQFKKAGGTWNNPIVIRDSKHGTRKVVSVGLDRWHIMKNLHVKKYEFLYLSNIEFSEDFKPKLEQLFTPDTNFEFYYDDESNRYKFEVRHTISESPNFNLKQWLKIPYIENHPSTIVAQPNRVSLRDAAIAKLRSR